MLQDVINHPVPEQLPIDEISSPMTAQILEFCDSELFPETLPNSEVTSCSNCCYEDSSSYTTKNLSFTQDINNTNTNTAATNNGGSNLSIIFDTQDEIDNDISASIDFSPSSPFSIPSFVTATVSAQQDQFDFCSLQPQIPITNLTVHDGLSQYTTAPHDTVVHPLMAAGPPLPSVFEEDCLSSVVPSYLRLNPTSPSCSFLHDPNFGSYLPGNLNTALSADSSGIFSGSILMGSEVLQQQDLEFQGDNAGIYCPDSMQRVFNSGELQVLGNESQQLVSGGGSSTPLASEISSLEESTFKVGKLSVEQRKEKIHRYMKKRNERNFSKKIKYACRKTLADSRPRVRGRFAKNDDFGETSRPTCSNHEDDEDEDVVVKEEDDMVDSSDIFAHISGVNSFKCNYPIQSWI